MASIREPVLFLSIYLHKQTPGFPDPRLETLKQVDAFARKYCLQLDSDSIPFATASEIDLPAIDDASHDYLLLHRVATKYPKDPRSGKYYQAVIYSYHDALVIQIQNSRFQDWTGSLEAGWQELASEVYEAFNLDSSNPSITLSTFGVSALYWVMCTDEANPRDYERETGKFSRMPLRRTSTDLGMLWFCDDSFFPNARLHEDRWLLITPPSSETEVNKRYYQTRDRGAPEFAKFALARHKMFFEIGQHRAVRKTLEQEAKTLDALTSSFLETQSRLGSKLDEVLSQTANTFQTKLGRATYLLAEYRNQTGRLRELRKTIDVNRRIYLINAIQLMSEEKRYIVARSSNRDGAATEILDACTDDGIFGFDLGIISQYFHQLDTDIEYAQSRIDRHTSSLRSGSDQLRIAGEREIAEIAHHMAVDSAAVIASIGALVVMELAVKPHMEEMALHVQKESPKTTIIYHNNLEGWFLMGAVVLATYGVTQAVGSRVRRLKPGLKTIAAAFGLMFCWIALVLFNHGFSFDRLWRDNRQFLGWLPGIVAAGVAGSMLGYAVYQGVWSHFQNVDKTIPRTAKAEPDFEDAELP